MARKGRLSLIDVATFPVDMATLIEQAHKQVVFPYFINWLFDCGFPVFWTSGEDDWDASRPESID